MNSTPLRTPTRSVLGIVVTHDRLPMLKECVDQLRSQTYPVDILIVDNSSSDGTAQWVTEQHDVAYIRQQNVGGAGGFYTAIKAGYWFGYDLVWCMDDDVAPTPDCLEELIKVLDREEGAAPEPIGWVCSRVTDEEGALVALNHPLLVDRTMVIDPACAEALPAHSCSFVSVCVTRQAVDTVGLPLREMFIWLDDVEYTRRITLAGFRGLVAPRSVAVHRTSAASADRWLGRIDRTTRSKYRYHFRNTALLMRTLSQGSPTDFVYRYIQAVWRATMDLVRSGKGRWVPYGWFWLAAGLFVPRRIDRADAGWERVLPDLL